MTGRFARVLLLAAISLALICGGTARAATLGVPLIPGGGIKLPATAYWKTCKARAWAARPGGYWISNDIFKGAPGRSCISSDGDNLTVLTNATPGPMGVTVSPMVNYGEYFGYRDAQSRLPLPVSWIEQSVLTRHFSCTGHAAGSWTCDAFDAFFSPSEATAGQHGRWELVVITRNSYGGTPSMGHLVRIGGHWWRAMTWITHPASVGLSWPIMRLYEVHQQSGPQKLRLPALIKYCVRMGWMPASAWLANDPARPEIWSGGKGLHISIGNGDTIRLPAVIRGAP